LSSASALAYCIPPTRTALRNGVAAALSKTQAADDSITAGRKKPANNALKKAARKLIDFDHRLRSLRSPRNIAADTRAALLADAGPILDDLKTLRKQL
jgi:hypothetical protein